MSSADRTGFCPFIVVLLWVPATTASSASANNRYLPIFMTSPFQSVRQGTSDCKPCAYRYGTDGGNTSVDKSVTGPIFVAMIQDIAPLLLDSLGPRDAARRTMNWLMDSSRARSIALYALEEDGLTLRLLISSAADEDTLDGARSMWAARGSASADGEAVRGEHAILVPTRPAGTFVYADGVDAHQVDPMLLADGGAVAAQALKRTARGFARSLEGQDRSRLKREELVATLHLHEWNIARVARVKGVTRKTIYDWIEKYEIERQHIPKG
jgi:hypothetical protein